MWHLGLRLSSNNIAGYLHYNTHITHAMMTAKQTIIITSNFQFNEHYCQNETI